MIGVDLRAAVDALVARERELLKLRAVLSRALDVLDALLEDDGPKAKRGKKARGKKARGKKARGKKAKARGRRVTPREHETIARRIRAGDSIREVAKALGMSWGTVKKHAPVGAARFPRHAAM